MSKTGTNGELRIPIKPDWSETNLIIPSLEKANLTDVIFYGTNLTGVDFHRADLEGAILENTNLLLEVLLQSQRIK